MDIEGECTGATLSITEEDVSECFEGVGSLKYLGGVLHQSDKERPAFCQNIWRERQVW